MSYSLHNGVEHRWTAPLCFRFLPCARHDNFLKSPQQSLEYWIRKQILKRSVS